MAVVIETTIGDITIDLFVDQRPQACLNFIKLCKLKYYNFNLFHTIRNGFIAQTGDPSGEGSGGESIWGAIDGPEKRYFSAETRPKIKHSEIGTVSMVAVGDGMIGSQFFVTLASGLDSLDGQHCVIGEVSEGYDVLRKLNEVICDSGFRPYQDVRITHTVILEDPFNDPKGLREPSRSPSPSAERLAGGRIAPDEELDETKGKTEQEIHEMIQEKEAKARATILEIVGDLPDADIAPPENVLFVCKLNPVTTDEDLEIIFSRFGPIKTCEVIRDRKTNDSLQYAFIEFKNQKSCEDAYFKMDNVLIDDRRIHVDFSQSVSKLQWKGKGRGVVNLESKNVNSAYNHKENRNQSNKNVKLSHDYRENEESRGYKNSKSDNSHREKEQKTRHNRNGESYREKDNLSQSDKIKDTASNHRDRDDRSRDEREARDRYSKKETLSLRHREKEDRSRSRKHESMDYSHRETEDRNRSSRNEDSSHSHSKRSNRSRSKEKQSRDHSPYSKSQSHSRRDKEKEHSSKEKYYSKKKH